MKAYNSEECPSPQVPVSTTLNLSPMGVGGSEDFRILLRYINPTSAVISGVMTVGGGVGE